VLRLSLLRSPDFPDPHADEVITNLHTALSPPWTWRDALTIRRGYELNYKLIPMPTANHQGALAPEHSFLQIQPDHVVVTAVKNAEDGNELVLRFYEWAGREADVRLHLSGKAESAAKLI